MYGASKRFIYTSFEHGNAMGDSIGHFDRIILKGTFERVKFNRYDFLCEEVPLLGGVCRQMKRHCLTTALADYIAPNCKAIHKRRLQ